MRKLLFLGLIPALWCSIENPAEIKDRLNIASYTTNVFSRKLGRDLERVTRPQFLKENLGSQILSLASLPLTTSLTLASFPIRTLLSAASSAIPTTELKLVQSPAILGQPSKHLSLLSFNACLREGFVAPYTAGVVPPSEAVDGHSSRSAAIAQWIVTESPDIFLGQEFNDPAAVEIIMQEMKRHGYTAFIYDPHLNPFSINCGLFIASKRTLSDVALISFPFKHKGGIAKFARRGAITCSVLDDFGQPLLRIYNTHLDAGLIQDVRNNQLKEYILPTFSKETIPSVLVGDLNFDTAQYRFESGLDGYVNILEGQVTCNDEGKLTLRGMSPPANKEKIDAIIANTTAIQFTNVKNAQVKSGKDILSDHYGVGATINL